MRGVPVGASYARACRHTMLAAGNPKASPDLLADMRDLLQMSELLQSLLARSTGPDGTSTESRESHQQDDRGKQSADEKAGTRVELVDLT